MSTETAVFLVGIAVAVLVANLGALIGFVINASIKYGQLVNRVDNAEQDINGLGDLIRRNEKQNSNRRNAS